MTLPTRPDGGIAVGEMYILDGAVFISGRSDPLSLSKYTSLVSAHTRERCAKWHDGQEKIALECGHREIATWHRLAAEKFRREMED